MAYLRSRAPSGRGTTARRNGAHRGRLLTTRVQRSVSATRAPSREWVYGENRRRSTRRISSFVGFREPHRFLTDAWQRATLSPGRPGRDRRPLAAARPKSTPSSTIRLVDSAHWIQSCRPPRRPSDRRDRSPTATAPPIRRPALGGTRRGNWFSRCACSDLQLVTLDDAIRDRFPAETCRARDFRELCSVGPHERAKEVARIQQRSMAGPRLSIVGGWSAGQQ